MLSTCSCQPLLTDHYPTLLAWLVEYKQQSWLYPCVRPQQLYFDKDYRTEQGYQYTAASFRQVCLLLGNGYYTFFRGLVKQLPPVEVVSIWNRLLEYVLASKLTNYKLLIYRQEIIGLVPRLRPCLDQELIFPEQSFKLAYSTGLNTFALYHRNLYLSYSLLPHFYIKAYPCLNLEHSFLCDYGHGLVIKKPHRQWQSQLRLYLAKHMVAPQQPASLTALFAHTKQQAWHKLKHFISVNNRQQLYNLLALTSEPYTNLIVLQIIAKLFSVKDIGLAAKEAALKKFTRYLTKPV